ncbi:MAG: hypothetical protein R6X25_12725 [Candidatus Krumholzibacteriia bacterium]
MKRMRMNQGRRPLVGALVPPALCLSLLAVLCAPAGAREELAGSWRAVMKTPQGEVAIDLQMERSEREWTGTISDPTGSGSELRIEALSIGENTISFNFRPSGTPFPASFYGNYLSDDDVIRGTFSIAGRSSPLTRFERTSPIPDSLRPAEDAEVKRGRQRHFGMFGLSGRAAYFQPVHILKDNDRNLNDLTTADFGWDAGLRWFVLDGFALFGRYFSGSMGFDTEESRLAPFGNIGLTADSVLDLTGYEGGIHISMGNLLVPESRFNPYATAVVGQVDWSVGESGRGSAPLVIDDVPLEGTDWHVGLGLGTEFALSRHLLLEFEWLWRFMLTEDEELFDPDEYWTNTQFWQLSAGLVLTFF